METYVKQYTWKIVLRKKHTQIKTTERKKEFFGAKQVEDHKLSIHLKNGGVDKIALLSTKNQWYKVYSELYEL